MKSANPIRTRLYVLYLVFCVIAVGIVGSIFKIQFLEGKAWQQRGENIATQYRDINAVRGNIYSEEGNLLCTSVPIYEIRMDFKAEALTDDIFHSHVDSLAYCLSRFFRDKTKNDYKKMLLAARKRGDRYRLIKRNIDFNQLQTIRKFPLFNLGRNGGGVIFEKQTVRVKPFGKLANRTLGYEKEGVAPVGLEGAYSESLAGMRGMRLEKRLTGGVWMPVEGGGQIEPEDGLDVVTTININIQDVAENALEQQLVQHDADHGCVVLMEVKTGEIKAIANLSRNSNGAYSERYNYAIGESTEPGSTFKLMSLLAALDDGLISINDEVNAGTGVHHYYGIPMHDTKKSGHGKISIQRALEVSSNIGVSKVISQHYGKNPAAFVQKLKKMGLSEKTGVEIYGEGKPLVRTPDEHKNWSGISLTQMSIGYELLLTPLQILNFYNAVANNGAMVKPRFVKQLMRNGEVVKSFEPEVLNPSIASKNALKQAQEMLEGVVEQGTAQNLRNAEFKIAGKTGTARIANASYGYKYSSKYSYQASFVGYFPADNPLYSCIVVVNAPSNSVYYGNLVAGPIFREIADKVYATSIKYHPAINEQLAETQDVPVSMNGYLPELKKVFKEFKIQPKNVKGTSEWVATHTRETGVDMTAANTALPGSNLVPNVRGMGLKDAIYLLENSGMEIEIEGYGVVKQQSIPAGERILPNTKIKLTLS